MRKALILLAYPKIDHEKDSDVDSMDAVFAVDRREAVTRRRGRGHHLRWESVNDRGLGRITLPPF